MPNEFGKLETPFLGSAIEVWRLLGRAVNTLKHDWYLSVDLGLLANGPFGQCLPTRPAAIRKSALRGTPPFVGSSGQIGFPPSLNTAVPADTPGRHINRPGRPTAIVKPERPS